MTPRRIITALLVFLSVFLLTLLFGAVHNQFSYMLSPEVFEKIWFVDFGFVEYGRDTPEFTAAIIGIWATLGVALIFALLYFIVVLIGEPPLKYIVWAVLIQAGVTLLTGIIGYTVGFFFLSPKKFTVVETAGEILNPKRFMGVYIMHTAMYMGAFFGVGISIVYLVRKRRAVTV